MKIIIFGAQGWIGQQLVPFLECNKSSNNITIIPTSVRADDIVQVAQLLDEIKPDRVVSVIGRTRGPGCSTIDYLEDAPKCHDKLALNMRDNLFAPLSLALACQERDIHFTYLGTGCIFTYDDEMCFNSKFDEQSNPNFFGSSYSVVKGYTDRLMRQLPNVLQARIRMPLTGDKSPYNFITKITTYDKICSVENSMTVLPTLLPILADMIINKTLGTINLTNPGTISHNRILELYKTIVDPAFTWTNFTEQEQNDILLSKRSNNHLDTTRLESMYNVPTIEQAVKSCLEQLKN